MNWLALDIGGANLKVADGLGYAQSAPFAMWREPARLAHLIRTVISEAPPCDHLAVTITGELADCFESKAAGVKFILQAVAAGSDNRHTRVYLSDGRLVSPQVAAQVPQLAAASNWHALATFACRFTEKQSATLIDVGSTTCDIIPLMGGIPAIRSTSDTKRLVAGELVYTGVERSPVCAVAGRVEYRGESCPLVQELFATMCDVYLILGKLPEDPADIDTADHKPATRAYARQRLGRMVAADREEFNHKDAVVLAQSVADAQASRLATAIMEVQARQSSPEKIILSGHGEFLAVEALELAQITAPQFSLTKELGAAISRSAPAHALAVLAREMTSQ